jgi:phage gp16-like protein
VSPDVRSATQHAWAEAQKEALAARLARGIRAIKAAQRQLGLCDDAYRALLEAQTRTETAPGKTSATELTLAEQGHVLDYMRRQGATNPKRSGGRKRSATPSGARAALMAKVHALLTELGHVTGENYSLNYADAICKGNGWSERVDFCAAADLHKLVGALSRTLQSKAAHPGGTP